MHADAGDALGLIPYHRIRDIFKKNQALRIMPI